MIKAPEDSKAVRFPLGRQSRTFTANILIASPAQFRRVRAIKGSKVVRDVTEAAAPAAAASPMGLQELFIISLLSLSESCASLFPLALGAPQLPMLHTINLSTLLLVTSRPPQG